MPADNDLAIDRISHLARLFCQTGAIGARTSGNRRSMRTQLTVWQVVADGTPPRRFESGSERYQQGRVGIRARTVSQHDAIHFKSPTGCPVMRRAPRL